MQEQRINLGYQARPCFYNFHKRKARWACIVAHRRAGKTVACVAELIASALESNLPDPRYAYIAPLYVQAKDVAWTYLKRFTQNIPGVEFNEAELRVDLPNKARIRLYGADNYERLRGIYLDGCILDEFADMPEAAWAEVIRPALSDRKGWAVFIGTPKGRNRFYDTWNDAKDDPSWYRLMLKASETHLIDQQELDDARKVMTDEQYEQEYECSFQAALIGSYYGKEITKLEVKKRICNVPYDPLLPVYTAWDLGMDDATAIWFAQFNGAEIRLIDYYENSGIGLDHYVKVLKRRDYNYAEHYLPHDTKVRELGTGRSRLETLESMGLDDVVVVPAQSVEDGINAVRLMLPRCWFDEKNTAKGLEALRQYQREYDDKLKTFKNRPRHDWTSHSSDAARMLALSLPDSQYKEDNDNYYPETKRSWMTS